MIKAFYIQLVFLFCVANVNGQTESVSKPPKFTKPENPDTIYYNFYNGVQMIEVDILNFTMQQKIIGDLMHRYPDRSTPLPNPIIFRNSEGAILAQYNIKEKDYSASDFVPLVALIGKTRAHNSNPTQPSAMQRYMGYYYPEPGYGDYIYKVYPEKGFQGKVGLIDTLGNYVIKPLYNSINYYQSNYYVQVNSMYGLIDAEFKMRIPTRYKELDYLSKNLNTACDTVCGLIDNNGKTMVPFIYGDFESPVPGELCFIFEKNDRYGLMDTLGNVVTTEQYEALKRFEKGFFAWKDNTKAIINKNGRQMSQFKYNYGPILLNSGHYLVGVSGTEQLKKTGRDFLFGLLDSFGNTLIKPKYERLEPINNSTVIACLNNQCGLITNKGKRLSPLKYHSVNYYGNGYCLVVTHDLLWGIINSKGQEIIPPMYKEIICMSEGAILVKNVEGKTGCLDLDNKVILPFSDEGKSCFTNGIARVQQNGKWALVNRDGKDITEGQYDEVNALYNGLALVKINGKFGFIDSSGKEIIPRQYDWVYHSPSKDALIIVKSGNKYGCINHQGTVIIPIEYDSANVYANSENYITLKKKERTYIYDQKGELIYEE